jgi:Golgi SNAP receptor complex protein 1
LAQRLSISGGSYSQSSTSSQQQRSSLLEHVESGTASSFNHPNTNLTNNNSINNSEEEHLSKEISRLLSSFTELLNTRMSPASERTGRSQHALLVKRYREILFDCGSDYYKTMEVVRRKKEARELMRGAVTNGAAGAGGGGGEGDGMEHLLRERSSIDASLNSTNAILSQASSVRNELRTQGQNLRGISGTMSVIAGHVPGLNGLIDKIKKKRMQDDRVVSGVVAGCILFTLWYLFG